MNAFAERKAPDGGDYYAVLGVPETATPEEIKRAYYRLVRRRHPGEDPEAFQKINEARQTLGDARRRGAYDQLRRSGRVVQALMDQAAGSLEKSPRNSMLQLKSAVALAPDAPRPRALLGQALLRAKEYEAAEKQYRWLVKESPADETLRFRLARCLYLQERLGDAEDELRHALRINPLYFDAQMLLSRVYEATGRAREASAVMEEAIRNDGAETVGDLDALMRLFVLYWQTGGSQTVEPIACRILVVLPEADESDGRTRAVERIVKRAGEMAESGDEPVALALLDVADRAARGGGGLPDELAREITALTETMTQTREARRIQDDPLIESALKASIHLKYLDRSTANQRRVRMDTILSTLHEEIIANPRSLAAAIEYIRREYPHVAAEQATFLQELMTRVQRRLQIIGPETRASGSTVPLSAMPVEGGRKGLFGWLGGGSGRRGR